MPTKAGEFFVELLVDASSGSVAVKDLVSQFGNLEIATLGEVGALIKIAQTLAQVADQAIETAVSFSKFEAMTALSSQELQKWQIVAEQTNVSTETVASSIISLQRAIAAISMGDQGPLKAFQLLGIAPGPNAFAVLDQLRDRLRNVAPAKATNLLQQMGLNPEMLMILRLSNEQFAQFEATARGMTGEGARKFLGLNLALHQFVLVNRDISRSMAEWLTPAATQLLEDFTQVVKDLAYGFHELWNDAVMIFSALGKFPAAAMAVKLALAGIALELAPITASIAALLLVLDDLVAWQQKRKSVFGYLFGGKGEKREGFDPRVAPVSFGDSALGRGLSNMGKAIEQKFEIIVHGGTGTPEQIGHAVQNGVSSILKRHINDADAMTNNGAKK